MYQSKGGQILNVWELKRNMQMRNTV